MNKTFIIFGLLLMSGQWLPYDIPVGSLEELAAGLGFLAGLVLSLTGAYDSLVGNIKRKQWELYAKDSRSSNR